MAVILLERLEKLGEMGDVVNVKPGFARNYLLPEEKALRATKANREYFEAQRTALEAANRERREAAEKSAVGLRGMNLPLVRQASDNDQLYGSVTARDIAQALQEKGFEVESRDVGLDQPIKTLGRFDVPIILHPEVRAGIRVNVARNEEDAEALREAMEAGVAEEVDTEEYVAADEPVDTSQEETPVEEAASAG